MSAEWSGFVVFLFFLDFFMRSKHLLGEIMAAVEFVLFGICDLEDFFSFVFATRRT